MFQNERNACLRMREIHIKIVGMLGGRGGGSPPEPAPRDPHLDHIHRAVLVARWANPQQLRPNMGKKICPNMGEKQLRPKLTLFYGHSGPTRCQDW